MNLEIAAGTKAMIERDTYMKQVDKLKAELAAKEQRFVESNKRASLAYTDRDTWKAQASVCQEGLVARDRTIQDLQRNRPWGLSIATGYGASWQSGKMSVGPAVVIGLSYNFVKF
jgi:hypothetical protein